LSDPITAMLASVLAAAPGADDASSVAASVQVQSIWDFIVKGGVMMIPIGICSFIALAVVVERLVTLRRTNVIPASFLPQLKNVLRKHRGEKSEALTFCKRHDSPIARVVGAGIKKLGAPLEVVEKHVEEQGQREVLKLRRFVRVLSVVAAITPLMGLLGTIFGMIRAFQTVALSGEALGKAELLAEGIYEAMITTAAGLIVAIPVLICYHWISARIQRLVLDMDELTFDFIEEYADGGLLAGDAKADAAAAAPAAKVASSGAGLPGGGDVSVAAT
jgi:biopolymer transport protein ExbB